MSGSKEVDEVVTSSSDHAVGTTKPVSWLDRLGGQKIDLNDLGREYFQQSLQYDQAQLERDAIKVRRKLDFYVLPIVRFCPCFLEGGLASAYDEGR